MSTTNFSAIAANSSRAFNPLVDVLWFDLAEISASELSFTVLATGLRISAAGKSFTLLGAELSDMNRLNLGFVDGSLLVNSAAETPRSATLLGAAGQDLLLGTAAFAPLELASRSAQGMPANAGSSSASLSADGRYTAFISSASNLVAGDNNGRVDVFLRDNQSGVLSLISKTPNGAGSNGDSVEVDLSGDGRTAVFTSYGNNLTSDLLSNQVNMFTKDMSTGAVTWRGAGSGVAISGDGQFVVFEDRSSNPDGKSQIYQVNLGTGSVNPVSITTFGLAEINGDSFRAAVSANGRYVAFESSGTNFGFSDTNGFSDIFLRDMSTDNAGSIRKISVGSGPVGGSADGASYGASISDDGAFVAFYTGAGNLISGPINGRFDVNGLLDVYVKSVAGGLLVLASTNASGQLANGHSYNPVISGNGRYVTFQSLASNLVEGDDNAAADVFVKDLVSGAIVRVSVAASGVQGNADSFSPTLSADGSHIAFEGYASNLGSADMVFASDIFVGANPLNHRVLSGGAGDDIYDIANAADQIIEVAGGGDDLVRASISVTLAAEVERLVLTGSAHLNGTGNALGNTLTGNAGNNFLDGGAGADQLVGGAGDDSYRVDTALDQVVEALDGGTDSVLSTVSLVLAANVENLRLIGSGVLSGTGNALANTIEGSAGTNVLNGGAGVDTLSYANAGAGVTVSLAITSLQATGGAGSDRVLGFENLTGSAWADHLSGHAGANVLNGGAGADTLIGGAGNDSYWVDDVQDQLVELSGGGVDTVYSTGSFTLAQQFENLVLTGSASINATGNAANNVLTGNNAANVLSGGAGFDTASYVAAAASVTVNLSTGLATGGGGQDVLIGIENLVGSAFADNLTGSAGNNQLAGGAGIDMLTGGGGNDSFLFNTLGSYDRISDFNSGDTLRISQSSMSIGDGDRVIEGAETVTGPGGFSNTAELVVFTADAANIDPFQAAAIGSANANYALGQTALFAVDNGAETRFFRFTSSGTDSLVTYQELALIGVLQGYAAVTTADFLFVA